MTNENGRSIAVIGAAGKMGRGIALILLQEMAREEAELFGAIGKKASRLYLIDSDFEGVFAINAYLKRQLKRYAEKKIVILRRYFADRDELISNEEVITYFVEGAMGLVRQGSDLQIAKNASLIVEAVVEEEEVKIDLFKKLKLICDEGTFFFSNTSSIPIGSMAKKANIEGRLIGYHFYNPPPVQKLVELIAPEKTEKSLITLAHELGKRLGKILVPSEDVAGFIGNGHFIREICFACDLVTRLESDHGTGDAVWLVDTITREWLLRPMGIFQLVDYVGIDIFQKIAFVMNRYLPGSNFSRELIDTFLERGIKGGQDAFGKQKEGFFRYSKGHIDAVYNVSLGSYETIDDEKEAHYRGILGVAPDGMESWKQIAQDPKREEKISVYQEALVQNNSWGGKIANEFLGYSRVVVDELVANGVAKEKQDVHTILKNGFYQVLL